MSTHSLTTALTLYRSGTLSLSQAARHAGCTEGELVSLLGKHGIPVRAAQVQRASGTGPSAQLT